MVAAQLSERPMTTKGLMAACGWGTGERTSLVLALKEPMQSGLVVRKGCPPVYRLVNGGTAQKVVVKSQDETPHRSLREVLLTVVREAIQNKADHQHCIYSLGLIYGLLGGPTTEQTCCNSGVVETTSEGR